MRYRGDLRERHVDLCVSRTNISLPLPAWTLNDLAMRLLALPWLDPYLVRCRPAVMDGLSRLRSMGWRVAIITNGTADNQLGKIKQTGLAEAVDAYVLSGIEGVRKPEAALFEIAAERCNRTLAQGGWMIGDNLTADIAGGRAVGLRTAWIDRGTWPDHEHNADHVVADVFQAMEILEAEG
ncbi:HAD family hydrolase [Microtetraspora sp. AC03309]|uniref:HAD family hydrolase n=1 Tax=Microtetraspora sp. AC03309 TaxID=2779376 RepID=UPI0027E0E9BD|nr:HAD family hydrolase [Microtetraspora sp. AC03309]MCC5578199.1 HAD family hydrolase [Microtetraspora sp. AC03309]